MKSVNIYLQFYTSVKIDDNTKNKILPAPCQCYNFLEIIIQPVFEH